MDHTQSNGSSSQYSSTDHMERTIFFVASAVAAFERDGKDHGVAFFNPELEAMANNDSNILMTARNAAMTEIATRRPIEDVSFAENSIRDAKGAIVNSIDGLRALAHVHQEKLDNLKLAEGGYYGRRTSVPWRRPAPHS